MVQYSVFSSQNGNTRMEDTWTAIDDFETPNIIGNNNNTRNNHSMKHALFCVFDGHNGRDAAEWCSDNFHHLLAACLDDINDHGDMRQLSDDTDEQQDDCDYVMNGYDRMQCLRDAFVKCDQLLHDGCIKGGCTAAVLWLMPGIHAFEQENNPRSNSNENSKQGNSANTEQVNNDSLSNDLGKQVDNESLSHDLSHQLSNTSISKDYKSHENTFPLTILTGNVGDTRILLLRPNKQDESSSSYPEYHALRLSVDHSASTNVDEQQRIRDGSDGFIAYNRVNGMYAITRTLGDHDSKDCLLGLPHVSMMELSKTANKDYDEEQNESEINDVDDGSNSNTMDNDVEMPDLLVLATDGIWDALSDETVAVLLTQLYRQTTTEKKGRRAIHSVSDDSFVEQAAELLARKAIAAGSRDNITVIVVSL